MVKVFFAPHGPSCHVNFCTLERPLEWTLVPQSRHAAWLIRDSIWARLLCLLSSLCCSAVTRSWHPLPRIWFHSGNITFSFLDWAGQALPFDRRRWVSYMFCLLAAGSVNLATAPPAVCIFHAAELREKNRLSVYSSISFLISGN